MNHSNNPTRIFRSFALPLATFNYLKKFQREYYESHQLSITNNEALMLILSEHQQMIEGFAE